MKQIFLILIGLTISVCANYSRDEVTQIVTDHTTGLQWQDNNTSENKIGWEDAIGYCETLDLGQKSDWRLPNFNELYFLTNRDKKNPALNEIFKNLIIRNTMFSFYWSSTSVVGTQSSVWGIEFYYGYFAAVAKSKSYWVRCVRGGE